MSAVLVLLLAGHGFDPFYFKFTSQVNNVFLEFQTLLDLELLELSSGLALLRFLNLVDSRENLANFGDVRCWVFGVQVDLTVSGLCGFFLELLLLERWLGRIRDQLNNFGFYLLFVQITAQIRRRALVDLL